MLKSLWGSVVSPGLPGAMDFSFPQAFRILVFSNLILVLTAFFERWLPACLVPAVHAPVVHEVPYHREAADPPADCSAELRRSLRLSLDLSWW